MVRLYYNRATSGINHVCKLDNKQQKRAAGVYLKSAGENNVVGRRERAQAWQSWHCGRETQCARRAVLTLVCKAGGRAIDIAVLTRESHAKTEWQSKAVEYLAS